MSRLLFCIVAIVLSVTTYGQVEVHLNFSQNFYNVHYGKEAGGFSYGGLGNATISAAGDIEYLFKRKAISKRDSSRELRKMMILAYPSLLLSAHYTSHSLFVHGFNEENDPIRSEFHLKYIYLPVIFKYNFEPFLLDEQFRVGIGIGVAPSILVESTLRESAIIQTRDGTGTVISEQQVQDDREVSDYAKKVLYNFSFELSWSIGRIYVAQRVWFSLRDQFMASLENDWNVPTSHSVYFGSQKIWPKVTYGGGAFVIGLRLY